MTRQGAQFIASPSLHFVRVSTSTAVRVRLHWVSPDATERHIKAAITLTRVALRLWANEPSRADRVFVIVPCDPDFSQRVYLTLVTTTRTELLVCVESLSGRYGRPPVGLDIAWSSQYGYWRTQSSGSLVRMMTRRCAD